MRKELLYDLEIRIKRLKEKKLFYENISLKHIPNLHVFIEVILEAISSYCNKLSLDIDDEILEIEGTINDLCGLNVEK